MGPGFPLCFASPFDGEGADRLTPAFCPGVPFFLPPSADGGASELLSVPAGVDAGLGVEFESAEALSRRTTVGVPVVVDERDEASFLVGLLDGNWARSSEGRRIVIFLLCLVDFADLAFGVDEVMVVVDMLMGMCGEKQTGLMADCARRRA